MFFIKFLLTLHGLCSALTLATYDIDTSPFHRSIMQKVSFTAMADGNVFDFWLIAANDRAHASTLPIRLLQTLERLQDDDGAYQISRFQHCLQTATRAANAGADDELLVAALLHDVGDVVAPDNHAAVAAEILRPYVRDEVYWVVLHHAEFQGFYYWHHIGRDRLAREKHRQSPFFATAERFAHDWDQASFDPNYPTRPLDYFRPVVERVFGTGGLR